jgi:hypothetical protein
MGLPNNVFQSINYDATCVPPKMVPNNKYAHLWCEYLGARIIMVRFLDEGGLIVLALRLNGAGRVF